MRYIRYSCLICLPDIYTTCKKKTYILPTKDTTFGKVSARSFKTERLDGVETDGHG